MLAYVRQPDEIDYYMGTWAGSWPAMEAMTLIGTMRYQNAIFAGQAAAPVATPVYLSFYVGGSNASAGTFEVVFDRWRLTGWG
jgi:hypothetical protein